MCHDSRARFHLFIVNLVCFFNVTSTFRQVVGLVTAAVSPFRHFLPAPTPIPPSLPPLSCMYVIAVTGTSVVTVMQVLVGQSSFNLVESRR